MYSRLIVKIMYRRMRRQVGFGTLGWVLGDCKHRHQELDLDVTFVLPTSFLELLQKLTSVAEKAEKA